MENRSISEKRSEVIEKFINIELIISSIISQHYFKKVIYEFYFEVLYDEYFSFALKRRILEKIIEKVEKKKNEKLNRMNTIRNYFAYCNQEFFKMKKLPDVGTKGEIIDPRKTNKSIDFNKLYDEFMENYKTVNPYLAKSYKEKSRQLEKAG